MVIKAAHFSYLFFPSSTQTIWRICSVTTQILTEHQWSSVSWSPVSLCWTCPYPSRRSSYALGSRFVFSDKHFDIWCLSIIVTDLVTWVVECDMCCDTFFCRTMLVRHACDWKWWAARDWNVLILMSAELTTVAAIRSVSTGKHVTIKLGNRWANLKVSVCLKCNVLTRIFPIKCTF